MNVQLNNLTPHSIVYKPEMCRVARPISQTWFWSGTSPCSPPILPSGAPEMCGPCSTGIVIFVYMFKNYQNKYATPHTTTHALTTRIWTWWYYRTRYPNKCEQVLRFMILHYNSVLLDRNKPIVSCLSEWTSNPINDQPKAALDLNSLTKRFYSRNSHPCTAWRLKFKRAKVPT